MMPKGVEHESPRVAVYFDKEVRIPMMPKGVEHAAVLGEGDGKKVCEFQ